MFEDAILLQDESLNVNDSVNYESLDEEEVPEFPVLSNEGLYWSGKDYANTYKEDFKDVQDFAKGYLAN